MGTFQCTKCGCTLTQPTEPFHCPQCGSQGIGLFRAMGGAPAYGGMNQQGFQPQQPGAYPQQGGFGAPQGGFQANAGYPQQGGYPQSGMNGSFQQPGFGAQQGGFQPQQPGMGGGFQRPAQGGPGFGAMPGRPGFGGAVPGRPMGGAMPGGAMPGGAMPGGMNRMGSMPGNAMPGGGFRPQQGGFQAPAGGQAMGNAGMNAGFQPQRPGFGAPQGGMNPFSGQQPSGFGSQPGMNQPGMNPMGGAGMNQPGMNPMGGAGMNQPGMNPMGGAGMNPMGMDPGSAPMGQNLPQNAVSPQSQAQGFAPQMAQQMAPQMTPQMAPQPPVTSAPPVSAAPEVAAPQPAASVAPQAPQAPQAAPQVPSTPAAPASGIQAAQTPPQAPAAPQAPAPSHLTQKLAPKPAPKPVPRPAQAAGTGSQSQIPQRPAGTPPQRPGNMPPRPAGNPGQRPNAPVPPRPVQRVVIPSSEPKPSAPVEPKGIRVRQTPQRPGAGAASERPRYRAPEPRPQIRPETDRPERCYWGFPEQPPFTCDARPMRNAPVVDEKGRLVLVSQGKLFCLDITRPEPDVVWEYLIQSHVPGPVVVDQNGDYHLHAMDGYLHMVTKNGKQSYRPVQVGEPLGYAAPIVDGWGNTLISNYNGGLIRVNSQGQKDARPYFRSRAKLDSSGVIAGGVLYVGSEDGYLFAIDLDDAGGRQLWDQGKEVGYAGGFLNSSPAIGQDGIIVVATRAERLLGFHSTGEVAWTTFMPGQLLGSPVIDANGQIYVGASMATRQGNRGYLVCVDGATHKIRWQYETDDMIESTPCIGEDGTIYFGNNSGWLFALNSHGDKKWSAKFEAGIRSAGTIVAPNLLTFALDDDVLVGVRCDSEELAENGWPKLGHDNFHSFLGPVAPPKPVSEDAPE